MIIKQQLKQQQLQQQQSQQSQCVCKLIIYNITVSVMAQK